MPVTADLAKLLDKRYEKADLDLGHHKYFRAAQALSESPSPRSNAS